jgi:hypothetical protein
VDPATWRRPPTAVCRMFTHQFGYELCLAVKGQLVESWICRTLSHQEGWRSALEAKGWVSSSFAASTDGWILALTIAVLDGIRFHSRGASAAFIGKHFERSQPLGR